MTDPRRHDPERIAALVQKYVDTFGEKEAFRRLRKLEWSDYRAIDNKFGAWDKVSACTLCGGINPNDRKKGCFVEAVHDHREGCFFKLLRQIHAYNTCHLDGDS